MKHHTFLLYGANGYTGELIARFANQYGLQPVLAGRNEAALVVLSKKLQLPYVAFHLEDTQALHQALSGVQLVVHAAGPFQYTAKQMVEACIHTGTHYIDINGDIAVFEMIKTYNEKAKAAGVMLLPGAGFDVIPTDCIALQLKELMPDAHELSLAFATIGGSISHGTATTIISKLGEGGAERKQGKIVPVPLGAKRKWITFNNQQMFFMSIPWGDIATAHFSTGIPNIIAYTGIKKAVFYLMKAQWAFNWLLRSNKVRKYLQQKINERAAGPADDERASAVCYVWGQVKNTTGHTVQLQLACPEGYTLTMHGVLIIAKKILQGEWKCGYQTPSTAFGSHLILEIPGVRKL